MKKIGILTYHYSINEGAMLQAYALQEVCKKKFPNAQVEMVNYESFNAKKRDFINCFNQPRTKKSILAQLKRIQSLSHFKESHFCFNGKRLVSDDYEKSVQFINAQNYDGIIVGSDEVWKIILGKKAVRKFPNVYWMNDKIQAKKFSYAASANKTDYKNLDSKYREFVQQSFESYSLIGVRDQFTDVMVRDFLPKTDNVFKVIDPTLLMKFEQKPIEEKLRQRGFDFNKSTVIINLENQKISSATAQFFKKRGWQVISITAYCDYADINFVDTLDPLEWTSIIARCQFLVTSRFHGIIFSIHGKVPFLAIEKNAKFDYFKTSKLHSLLEDLQFRENLFIYKSQDFSAEALFEKLEHALRNTDFSYVDETIKLHRNYGLAYIQKVGAILEI